MGNIWHTVNTGQYRSITSDDTQRQISHIKRRKTLACGAIAVVTQYKLMRCSNKECCKQCRYVMFKGTMTKWPVQKQTQGTTQKLLQHHHATDI